MKNTNYGLFGMFKNYTFNAFLNDIFLSLIFTFVIYLLVTFSKIELASSNVMFNNIAMYATIITIPIVLIMYALTFGLKQIDSICNKEGGKTLMTNINGSFASYVVILIIFMLISINLHIFITTGYISVMFDLFSSLAIGYCIVTILNVLNNLFNIIQTKLT
ncbi:MAG: hypothetical protein J6D03_06790 [Clostridia bacterium]|nr:hypothetical protein [Clostridia bacterium]